MAKKYYNKTVQHHMDANIVGMLKHTRKGKLTFIDGGDGKPLTDFQARRDLNRLLAEGHQVIPTSKECYRFDKVNGCSGHIKSLKPTDSIADEIDLEWLLFKQGKRLA